ncbi:MAG: hypothetical protein JO295_14800 [Verrucomicrobia bacterium]|nr:hypothetical protein [Verrucomicrobiota bacterium]
MTARFFLRLFFLLTLFWLGAGGLMAHSARAGSVEDLDRDNGLPDAKLGTPVEAFQGLEQTEETGRWTTYRRPADKLKFGKFEVSSISYNFFKGKLYSIFIDVEGRRNTRGILKLLEENYGKNYTLASRQIPKSEDQLQTREWSGRRVYLLYKNADSFVGGRLTFLDKPTWDLLQVPKEERRKEIRKMLEGSYTNGDF